ncbi:MAG: cation:proton antiporter [Pseudomonadota bacterium]
MSIDYTLLLLVSLLAIALALTPPLGRLGLGPNVVLMLVGFVGSEIVVASGHDTGIRWNQFHEVVIFVLLPVLIFEGALHLDTNVLKRNVTSLLLLAGPGMLAVASMVAVALGLGTDVLEGAGWLAAALTGVLLAGTDATSILARLAGDGVPSRLRLLVEGESNFSDAMSVVLFSLLMAIGLAPQTARFAGVPGSLLFTVAGGLAVGIVAVGMARFLLPRLHDPLGRTVTTLIMVYVTYIVAESTVNVSGVVALLVLGVGTRSVLRRTRPADDPGFLLRVWAYKSRLASSFTFLLLGITIHVQMFEDHWRLMLAGIVILPLARALMLALLTPWWHWLPGAERLAPRALLALAVCGSPGAVSVALVLSLPLEFPGWYTVQCIVYGVVVFSLLVQTPLVTWALRGLKVDSADADAERASVSAV